MEKVLINLKISLLIIFGALLLSVLPAATVSAQGAFSGSKSQACQGANLSNKDDSCHTKESTSRVEGAINFIVNLLTVIVGIVAVIMIIINGLKFITSNGDSNSISSARHGIIYALVGLIIAALAQVIVRFVLSQV